MTSWSLRIEPNRHGRRSDVERGIRDADQGPRRRHVASDPPTSLLRSDPPEVDQRSARRSGPMRSSRIDGRWDATRASTSSGRTPSVATGGRRAGLRGVTGRSLPFDGTCRRLAHGSLDLQPEGADMPRQREPRSVSRAREAVVRGTGSDLVRAAEDLADARVLEDRAQRRSRSAARSRAPGASANWCSSGIGTVFVTTTCSIGASSRFCSALPLKIACVAPMKIGPAPISASTCTPFEIVAAVSIMSSTSTHGRPSTSPTTVISSILCASWRRAPLVEERQVGVQVLAELLGGLDATGVGRHDDQVVARAGPACP